MFMEGGPNTMSAMLKSVINQSRYKKEIYTNIGVACPLRF